MDNLTIGQRINVYEVVANFGQDSPHDYSIGTQLSAVDKSGSIFHEPWPIIPTFNGECLYTKEVRKCGYYLKVKSLKGGSNA